MVGSVDKLIATAPRSAPVSGARRNLLLIGAISLNGFRTFSPYAHGFARIAACVPSLRPADPAYNAARTLDTGAPGRHEAGAALMVFPELGISGYAIDDLLLQDDPA